jgi:F0F1-type ATP synthase assembly protein I
MRLLITCLVFVVLALTLQLSRPECSMSAITGVEWVMCLAHCDVSLGHGLKGAHMAAELGKALEACRGEN